MKPTIAMLSPISTRSVDAYWTAAAMGSLFSNVHPDEEVRDAAEKAEQDVHRLVTEGTIEQRIGQLLQRKRSLAESVLGSGEAAPSLSREDLFVTTKVWNDDHGYDATMRAFDTSMSNLGMEYVDLYLIHWPTPANGSPVETWQTLAAMKEASPIGKNWLSAIASLPKRGCCVLARP